MKRSRLATALATAALGAATLGPASTATGATHVSDPIASGLVGPLALEVSRANGVLVSQAFAGVISRVHRDGSVTDLIVEEPAVDGGTSEVGGIASRGRTIAYLYLSVNSATGQVVSQLKVLKPSGRTRVVADLWRFEQERNPDGRQRYGFFGLDEECAAEVAAAGVIPGTPYTGIVESNPYELARAPRGGWYVVDAAANAVLHVSKRGHIRVAYLAKPEPPVTLTAQIAAENQMPECVVGASFVAEPVPTDVEVDRRGLLLVSQLPGGPSLGANGSVVKVNPWSGRGRTVTRGLRGATNLAIGPRGKIYVTELFANAVSVVKRGRVRQVAELPAPAAVEYAHGRLWVTTDIFPPEDGPPNGKIVTITLPRHEGKP